MVKRGAIAVLFLPVLVWAGCQSLNPIQSLTSVTPEERHLADLMKWHSGEVQVYKKFETVFTARAVYLSEEVKEAAAQWEARSRLMTPEEKEALQDRLVRKRPGNLEFLLGFYTPQDELNVLEQDNGPWITYLKYPSGEMKRASCFGAGGDEQKVYQRFLRWDLSWSKLYILCYPDTEEAFRDSDGVARLVITGPAGTGEMAIKLFPPKDGQ